MQLDIEKLEKIKHKSGHIIARCPACAENGHDRKGEHLRIDYSGRFGCAIFPKESGKEHRKRIFQLVGIKDQNIKTFVKFAVNKQSPSSPKIIIKDVLVHLGQVNKTPAQDEIKRSEVNDYNKDSLNSVPSVPIVTMPPPSDPLDMLVSIECIMTLKRFGDEWNKGIMERPNDLGKNRTKRK